MLKLPTSITELTLHQAAALAGFRSASDLARRATELGDGNVNQRTVAGMMRGEPGYPAAIAAVAKALGLSEADLTTIVQNSRSE